MSSNEPIDMAFEENRKIFDPDHMAHKVKEIEREYGITWNYLQKYSFSFHALVEQKNHDIGILNGFKDYMSVSCPECGWANRGVSKWDLLIGPISKKCNRNGRYKFCEAEFGVALDQKGKNEFIKQVKMHMYFDAIAKEYHGA